MVAQLDSIFAEMEAAGIVPREKTISGIWAAEACRRTPVIDPHTLTNVDRLGHRIPQKRDPQLVAWGERANAALREAQAVVDGQQPHTTTPPVNPLVERAEKTRKSLFA
jgi:hypothetical protein